MSGRRENPDPKPVEWPTGVNKPLTMEELIRLHVRRDMSLVAQAAGQETFEEADDFDVEDEDGEMMSSPYELSDMPVDVSMQERATGVEERERIDEEEHHQDNRAGRGRRRGERDGAAVDHRGSEDEGSGPPEERGQGVRSRGEPVSDGEGERAGGARRKAAKPSRTPPAGRVTRQTRQE